MCSSDLATGGATRTALLPNLPTVAEAGVPGYDASNYWLIGSSAGTPAAVVIRINSEVSAVLKMPETQKRFTAEGAEIDFKTPAESEQLIKIELAKWARVAKEARMTGAK